MAPKRVFVHRSVATELEGRLTCLFNSTGTQDNSGDCSFEKESSLATTNASRQLRPLIEEALRLGAHFVAGDERANAPVILGGVDPSCALLRSDIFTPVLSIVTVADDLEAVRWANDCPFALSASIFSRDLTTARSLAGRIKAGVVTINDLILPTADPRLPFGGRARSGFGITRGREGLLELTNLKVVTVTRSNFRPAFAPAQPGDGAMFEAYLKLTHGGGLKSRCKALLTLIQSILSRKTSPKENL